MSPALLLLSSVLLLAAVAVALLRGLRRSRLGRRLFLLFLLLSALPTLLLLLFQWHGSRQPLRPLDSPGLHAALNGGLELGRQRLAHERARTQALADSLAATLAPGGPGPLPEGWSVELLQGERPLGRWGEGAAIAGSTRLLEAESPLPGAEATRRLRLRRPLPATLAAQLDAVEQGASRFEQLRLFYADLLRTDLLLGLGAVAFLLLVGSLLVARHLAGRIGGPIRELAHGTRRVAEGDRGHRVRTEAVDELGDLVRDFNRMTEQLEEGERVLRRTERLAAWQGVARRLAHEIKNPLTPIQLSLHRIRARVDDPTVLEGLRIIDEETQNLRRLADEFSLYARLPEPRLAPCRLGDLLAPVLELYAARYGVDARVDESVSRVVLRADEGQLRQVLANLVKNAVEAMGGDGTLWISAERRAERWRVRLRDSGPGLPDEATRLFEPDFSTKASGTGLGLAIARKIVEDHGGSIEAADAEEGGGVFTLEIPADPEEDS